MTDKDILTLTVREDVATRFPLEEAPAALSRARHDFPQHVLEIEGRGTSVVIKTVSAQVPRWVRV